MKLTAFYSDPHFGHTAILTYAQRPYPDVETMNRDLMARYNAAIGKADTVLWCGDCFFLPSGEAASILRRLNGTKLLVRGNHDKGQSTMVDIGFAVVTDELRLGLDGHVARVSHYPYRRGDDVSYQNKRPVRAGGEVLIHGHTHRLAPLDAPGSNALHDRWQIDVGVDGWGYAPAPVARVARLVAQAYGEP